eukprot:SAG22_NODE_7929_length_697_cov_0.578595_1_plen_31_part_10
MKEKQDAIERARVLVDKQKTEEFSGYDRVRM